MAVKHDDLALTQALLNDCVCAYLGDVAGRLEDYPGCPCLVCPTPGAPAQDNCCDTCGSTVGGQLNVWVERLYPSAPFPTPADLGDGGWSNCGDFTTMAAALVVSLTRCAPTMDDDGTPPSCDAQARAARILAIDMQSVYTAIGCCLAEPLPGARKPRKFLISDSRVVGPSGGCVTTETRVTVNLGRSCACPSHDSGVAPSAPLRGGTGHSPVGVG